MILLPNPRVRPSVLGASLFKAQLAALAWSDESIEVVRPGSSESIGRKTGASSFVPKSRSFEETA